MATTAPASHHHKDGQLHDGLEAQSYPTAEDQLKINDHADVDRDDAATTIAEDSTITSSSFFDSIKSSPFFNSRIRIDHGDLILFVCSFCTGLTDSSTFVAYSTFVSMQTGNTIFLTLAISALDPKPESWERPFLAVLMFCVGSAFFARFHIHLGSPRRRLALVINFAIQALLVMIAAIIIQTNAVSGDVPPVEADGKYASALAPVVLLAFQSAGQVVTSRALEVGEIPTVVVTSMLCDLFSDPLLFVAPDKNVKRNRRATGCLNTFVGGVIGGVMARRTGGIAPALWLAVAIKVCCVIAWCLWPAEQEIKKKGKEDV